ncbi:MAG: arginine-tRNA-protein transferase [Bacteroidota bacterium]|nr:arginine-tRNA-protein transferase [Bacteroidota bacterium]
MIKAIHFPLHLASHELDDYLARGWFRMGQTIFTTDFVPVHEKMLPVYWLRVLVQKVRYGKKQKRLLAVNKNFSVTTKPFKVTDELEELYALYRASVNFEAPSSVESFLLDGTGDTFKSVYDTRVIELRDAGQLIAAGIFDKGDTSIAGIMNFYNPSYKTKSLGKYLMLLKINYAIESGKLYYYPGYIVGGFPKFDYKLFPDPDATEFYDSNREEWISYAGASLPIAANLNMKNDFAGEA